MSKAFCMLIVVALCALALLAGCSGTNVNFSETKTLTPLMDAQTATVSVEDLKQSKDAVKAYFEAVIRGDYAAAALKTEAAILPEAQQKMAADRLKAGYGPLKLSEIVAIGPAEQDPQRPGYILVPYSIQGKELISDKAILRQEDERKGWLISGGI